MPENLRLGLLCSSLTITAWQKHCLEELLRVPGVEVSFIVLDESVTCRNKSSFLRAPVYSVYRKLFVHPKAFQPSALPNELQQIPVLRCQVQKSRDGERFSETDLQKIRSFKPDILLRFGFNILRGGILTAARFGVWSFHHGDEQRYRGRPSGFWELYNNEAVIGAVLQRLTDRLDAGIILYKALMPATRHSYNRTLDTIYRESSLWPARLCRRLQAQGESILSNKPSNSAAPVYKLPDNSQVLRFMARLFCRNIQNRWELLFCQAEWNIGVIQKPIHSLLNNTTPAVSWITKPAAAFWADPFACLREETLHILFEEYPYRIKSHGVISKMELPTGSLKGKITRMAPPKIHMSYPYLFEHEQVLYCVPETSAACELALYAAEPSLKSWKKKAVLIKGVAAVDATLIRHNQTWWLFCGHKKEDNDVSQNFNLFLWHAPSLEGPWQPHPGNPVKCDVRSSRPAGTPFIHEGVLYRPAQDCSSTYGKRVVINKITALSLEAFHEEPVAAVEADPTGPYPDGLHTLSAAGGYVVVDGKKLRPIHQLFIQEMIRRLFPKKSPGVFQPVPDAFDFCQ